MALPKIDAPLFETVVPSTGQKLKFRPFLVKEQKILLMAAEGKSRKEITTAILSILENCIVTKADVNKLATFDVEFLILEVRSKSVGEVIEVKARHTSRDNPCKHQTTAKIKISDIELNGEIQDGKIQLTDKIGIKMHYPTMPDVLAISDVKSEYEATTQLIMSCIDYVYDADTVYDDFTKEEMQVWFEELGQKQQEKISDFLNSTPVLEYNLEWKCSKCEQDDKITIRGLLDFFI